MSTDVPSYQTLLKNGTPKPEIREISLIHRLYEILFCSESTQLNLIFHDVVVWSLVFPNPYSYMGFWNIEAIKTTKYWRSLDPVGKSFFLRVSVVWTYLHTGFVSIFIHSIDQGLSTMMYFFNSCSGRKVRIFDARVRRWLWRHMIIDKYVVTYMDLIGNAQ